MFIKIKGLNGTSQGTIIANAAKKIASSNFITITASTKKTSLAGR
jgi:hypothetical protein